MCPGWKTHVHWLEDTCVLGAHFLVSIRLKGDMQLSLPTIADVVTMVMRSLKYWLQVIPAHLPLLCQNCSQILPNPKTFPKPSQNSSTTNRIYQNRCVPNAPQNRFSYHVFRFRMLFWWGPKFPQASQKAARIKKVQKNR